MKVSYGGGITAASGSMGGQTASRNRFGAYMRARAIPVNPNTSFQSDVRSYFSTLVGIWPTLTAEQRAGWQTYGNQTPVTDRMGNSIMVPGRQWFIGNNVLRLQAGLAAVEDAPTSFGLPSLTIPDVTITAGDPFSVAFTNTDSWATAVGGALLVFASDAKGPAVEYCMGPFRYAGKVAGAATPPTSPATITAPFAYSEGQRVFWRAVALTADGRVSANAYGNSFCGA